MRPPSGIVTFLFTDIERSTQHWEKHPAAMSLSLAKHDQLMRAAIAEAEGYVFKTVGDAFCAAFNSASNALRAAVTAQAALAAEPWNDTGPLRVRMALHSGEAEQRDQDYFGPTLNRVARLLSVGHGGQILVSSGTAELVRDPLPRVWSLRDLGERRLKDLSRPERIFQLVVPELASEFPPLRLLATVANNLPAPVTTFIGRAQELAEAKRLLITTRLLTLTGPGGTGKTRLSLQTAAEVLDRFPHGVWLIELATLSEPSLLPETIAGAIDVREEHGRPMLETLLEALRARRVLLVIDNCEHLIAACAAMVTALLRRCPELKVLASSREALNIQGETIQPVPPLPVPEFDSQGNTLTLERVAEHEAVQLFVERASAIRPGFALTPGNASLVARICWRLDGIPLAIELAAARIKVLSLEQILVRLDDRFRLLGGGSRTALPRQQTLGALIDWSYDLLSEPERILLRRLTVFVAGRTLEMAEEVCAGDGVNRDTVFELLSSLVEKSLLTIEPSPSGETRYTMLESVWDYGDDKLALHQETARYRLKHLAYFTQLAETAEPQLFAGGQKAWLEKLSFENYNLNAALRFSEQNTDDISAGLRLAGAIARYWEVRSYLMEGYETLQNLLARAREVAPAVRAKAELGAGRLAWCQDRDADALRHYRTALGLYLELGLREQAAMIETMIGLAERNDGNQAAARTHFERAKAIAEELPSERALAMALNGLGSLAADAGDFATARKIKERCVASFRALGDSWLVALVTGSLGRICFAAGDDAAARACLRESLISGRELGNKWAVPYAIEALANISAREGSTAMAVRLYGATSAQREALALGFSTTEKASYDRAISALRQSVSDQVFLEEWQNGRALSLEGTIELAMAAE